MLSRRKAQRFGNGKNTGVPDVSCTEKYTALAQILKDKNLTDAEINKVIELISWARGELNLRPHAYQACALTN